MQYIIFSWETVEAVLFNFHLFRRRTQRTQSGEPVGPQGPSTYEDELNGNYRKIHKVLGATNKNKDIRNEVKQQMDERIENHLTIGMNLTINPRFQLG